MSAPLLLLLAGLAGLILGGELLVRGAVSAAKSFRISPMVIGLTLVGFGTSAPELVTSLQAARTGAPGIAIGNVVGSNIGNVLLILGLAALLRPLSVSPTALRRDGTVLVLATALCLALVLAGEIGRPAGIALLTALALYLAFTFRTERRAGQSEAAEVYAAEAGTVPGPDHALIPALVMALAGLAITIVSARFLVAGAVTLAQNAGISETVIGLTIVAIGTSMPELATCVIAVRRGQGDVALGNVIGSNIFNILGILGTTALVAPMEVPAEILDLDIWVLCAATLALILLARTGWRIARPEGAAMLACYLAYLAILLV